MSRDASPDISFKRQAFFPGPADPAWNTVRVAHETWTPRRPVSRIAFPSCFLALVLDGQVTMHVDGQQADVHPGGIFAQMPGEDHLLIIHRPLHLRILVGRGAGMAARLHACAGPRPAHWHIDHPACIERLLEELLGVAEPGGPTAQQAGDDGMRLLLSLLAHERSARATPAAGASSTFAACRELVEREALRLDGVQAIADRCRLDRSYLSRLFRQHAGESPSHFLTRLKMRHAADRLAAGDSVGASARSCGYGDVDIFSRTFRRHFGLPPSQWRSLSV